MTIGERVVSGKPSTKARSLLRRTDRVGYYGNDRVDGCHFPSTRFFLAQPPREISRGTDRPVRTYTVIPLEEPVSPTAEPASPPPPNRAPTSPGPATKPELEPVK
jgi:hypothetical protein